MRGTSVVVVLVVVVFHGRFRGRRMVWAEIAPTRDVDKTGISNKNSLALTHFTLQIMIKVCLLELLTIHSVPMQSTI